MPKAPRRLPLLESLFTRQERFALAFLLAVGFLGVGVQAVWLGSGQVILQREVERPAQVRVNRAGIPELTALPGIGPVTARRIVEHRRRHGRFLTLTDLKRVKGITPRTLKNLKGHVRFD